MKKSAFKDNRGLTLVELMVGVTILAIIVVPLLHTFVVGAATQARSRSYGDATNAAQNLIEQIQASDPDTILNNATMVDAGARFYTLSGMDYTLYGTAPYTKSPTLSSLPKTYHIGIPNYTYGSSSFDALITLSVPNDSTANNPANSSPVAIGNQMDALLNMSQADANAVNELKYQCSDLVEHPNTELTAGQLTRSIAIEVSRSGTASPYTYTINVLFNYIAINVPCTAPGKTGTFFNFSHTEKSSASCASVADSTDGSPILSAFLFFDGYYRSDMTNETIPINNTTGADINFFLVNTNKGPVPLNYGAQITYKNQIFNGNEPLNKLVFANFPVSSYTAWKDHLTSASSSVSGYLVEEKALSRKFNVVINLYDTGSNFTGTPILTIDSTKLNY